jgi:hypothetical protein
MMVSRKVLSFSKDSQKKEVEDKVQGDRTKVEERREHPPWLYHTQKCKESKKDNARRRKGSENTPHLPGRSGMQL